MNKYINNRKITNEYNDWFFKLKKRKKELVKISDFVEYLNKKYSDEYQNISTSVGYWRKSFNRFIRVKNDLYIDKLFQEQIYNSYINEVYYYDDKNVLSYFRVNDSLTVKKRGPKISSFKFYLSPTEYEPKLNKNTINLFRILTSLRYFKSFKEAIANLKLVLKKNNISFENIKNLESLKKVINKQINIINKKNKTTFFDFGQEFKINDKKGTKWTLNT